MPKRGGSKGRSSLKKLKKLTIETTIELERELATSNDRGGAIIHASVVEEALRILIVQALANRDDKSIEPLLERDGALHTFFSKIHLAHAMGLIPKHQARDLDIIRRV